MPVMATERMLCAALVAAAHAALQHARVHTGLREDHHGRYGQHVELRNVVRALAGGLAARVHALASADGGRDATRKLRLAHGMARHLHALRHAHELRGGVKGDAKPLSPKDRRREARGRGLAVCARYLHALEALVGVAQLGEHVLHALEHGLDAKALRGGKARHRVRVAYGRYLEGNLVHGGMCSFLRAGAGRGASPSAA